MNYPYPVPGAQTNPAVFTADTTHDLGIYDKAVDASAILAIDYSGLLPAVTITGYSFRVSPGGMPAMSISVPKLTASELSFKVQGGIGGVMYNVLVNIALDDDTVRVDTLAINVLGDGNECACGPKAPIVPSVAGLSADGVAMANDCPRYFVSSTPPEGANVLDRWYDPGPQLTYDFQTDGQSTWWQLAT